MPVAVGRRARASPMAIVGAFALRSPAPAAAPRSSAPLRGRAAARARPARASARAARRRSRRSRRTCAPGRRAQAEAALRRARALLGAGDLRVQVAGALLRYRPGEVETSIGVLRALASDDDRAPCPRCISAWRCSGPGSAPRRRAQLRGRRARSTRTASTGSTADDVLHPTYRKGYPLWVRSQPGARHARAAARARRRRAPRSQAAQLDYAYDLQFSSRTRARLVAERALALDASNIDAQVAVIVLGFDKDVPAQAVGRLGQLMQSRAATRPARASTSASCSPGSARTPRPRRSTGRPLQLDPTGLIGRFARSVLDASQAGYRRSREGDRAPSANLGGHEHYLLARGPGRARSRRAR